MRGIRRKVDIHKYLKMIEDKERYMYKINHTISEEEKVTGWF